MHTSHRTSPPWQLILLLLLQSQMSSDPPHQTSLALLKAALPSNMQVSPTAGPLDLRTHLANAIRPYLQNPLYSSYILDTSPVNVLNVLSSRSSLHAAVTAAHSESALSPSNDTSFDFSYASEHMILPQIALRDAYLGVVISRHATLPSANARPVGTPFPQSEFRSGRCIVDTATNTLFTIAHNPQSSLSYGLFITSTSATTRERILFRVPTDNLSSIALSTNFLARAVETHPPQPSPTVADTPLRPAHPTDFRNFTFSTCPLIGAFHGAAEILRPDSRVSPHPLTSFCEMRGFSGNCAVTAPTHALVARYLRTSAARILSPSSTASFGGITPLLHDEVGFVDRLVPAAGVLPYSPVSAACPDPTFVDLDISFACGAPLSALTSLPDSPVSAAVCAPNGGIDISFSLLHSQKVSYYLSAKNVPPISAPAHAADEARPDPAISELPPSIQRRNIRKRTEAEETEREGRRTNKNRAAATRANARRRFIRDQLEAAERQVAVLESRRHDLVEENAALRKVVAATLQRTVYESVQAA